ncbi:outer membrane lipoprotein-sorting protein [Acidipila sp. EB88]|uniref:LolA family protein n=1 Tax=Acidipila sp. EB88 TaxID=2305226 RepID=UPI000F5E631F|nr:outer membrane lipoprotein-sorting protein [Acidipila sp. EB88]RRA47866.1 outer membrane lipoprotein carrier protein LolA [Acidipila sp. EB88]
MKPILRALAGACFLLAGVPGAFTAQMYAQGAPDPRLSKVLAQMDAAAARFQSAQAEFAWDQLTVVVQEHEVQKGEIAFRRTGKETAMAAHVLTDDGQPSPKDVLFRNGEVALYEPKIKQETILQGGKNQQQFEAYVTLGFGGSGKDLESNWNVTYGGTETIDGTPVTKLGLVPKHAGPDPIFSRVEIWIDPATATSLKQVFYTPGGDNRTATYSKIKLNSAPESAFKLDIPKGTNVIRK